MRAFPYPPNRGRRRAAPTAPRRLPGAALWWHEARRAGWTPVVAPLIASALIALIATIGGRAGAGDVPVARTLLSSLEMAMPLAAGLAAASLVGRDPLVELQLTLPTRYRTTVLRRYAVTLGWLCLVSLAVAGTLIATGWWYRWPGSHGALVGQLTWLAPSLWLGGLGLLAAAALRGPAAAGGVVAGVWIFEQVLSTSFQQHTWGRLCYLFATTRGAAAGDWTANRLTLLGTSIPLILGGWLLLSRGERLLAGVSE